MPMAKVFPDGWNELAVTGAALREIETLRLLHDALPDGYSVYHAVHWTNIERGFSVYGEIDFVIVNRAGALLLIEQKSGFLEETPQGLVKRQSERSRNVPLQMARLLAEVRERLSRRPGCEQLVIEYLLFCPDYKVRHPETAGIHPERIVDATRRDKLIPVIRALLPEGHEAPAAHQVHRFLRDVIQLDADVSALVGRAQAMVTRLSGGLAHWARQLEFSPYRLRVTGTAGSGKTQLALAEYRAAIDAGRRPMYVCFNRPLADHFAQVAPAGGRVCTFHMLCEARLRDAGITPDFNRPDPFTRLVEDAMKLPVTDTWRYDTLIVDEGQDFPPEWQQAVLRHARDDSRALWLEDPMQNLYDRPTAELPGWVRLYAQANYRSPRAVVRMLQRLLPPDVTIDAQAPFDSAGLEVHTYSDSKSLLQATKEGLTHCLAAGFRRGDIAVISFRGRDHSEVLAARHFGPHRLRSFTGGYDLFGQPVYQEGDVVMESVFRFKGQAAPAVVFTEIDFENLDERVVRRLFVGATRASMKLVMVMSERAAERLQPLID